MATGTTQLDDMVQSELVAQQIIETARTTLVMDPWIQHDTLFGSNVKSYTRFVEVSAGVLTEGTDATATTMTDSQVSATLAGVGIGVVLTDEMRVAATPASIAERIARELGLAYAKKIDTDNLALLVGLTDSVGATTVALTEDVWLQGIFESDANDIGGRPLAFFGAVKQIHQLRIAFAGTTENQSALLGRGDILTVPGQGRPNGYVFSYMGIDLFQSTNVAKINTNADYAGGFVVVGPESPFIRVVALLDGMEWDGRREVERDASLRATELWVTGRTVSVDVAPDRGCRVISGV